MSLYEYNESQAIAKQDVSFYGLVMAAMRKADDENLVKLKTCWPEVWDDLRQRYDAPGGLLPGETVPE